MTDMTDMNDDDDVSSTPSAWLDDLLSNPTVWSPVEPADQVGVLDRVLHAIAAEADTAGSGAAGVVAATPITQARSHRRRWYELAGTGVAAAAIAVVAMAVLREPATPEVAADHVVAMQATNAVPTAAARVEVSDLADGTELRLVDVSLPPAAPGTYYEAWMWASPTQGVSAGTFHMRGGEGWVVLWSGVTTAAYPHMTITVQPEGDHSPSDMVVLAATLTG